MANTQWMCNNGSSMDIDQTPTISIQGYPGSFHHQASTIMFGDQVHLLHRDSFDDVIQDLLNGVAHFGIMAIHNNNIGAITTSQNLIQKHAKNISVLDDLTLPVNQHLIATKDTNFEQIVQVSSHPLALQQCQRFFNLHPSISLENSVDTALSVKNIIENNACHIGGIGGFFAAEYYDAQILYSKIQDRADNETTFALIART